MCSHYESVLDQRRFADHFMGLLPAPNASSDVWPAYESSFIRRHEFADVGDEAVPEWECLRGTFGLIPHWAKDDTISRKTYNARSETVHEKPSFRDSWKAHRHCIIPAEAFYEPDWRSGKAVATRITNSNGEPMGIAGLWSKWTDPSTGEIRFSFTMLTINAADHPFMKHFHRPTDEKRMIVVLHPSQYRAWLNASARESKFILNAQSNIMLT